MLQLRNGNIQYIIISINLILRNNMGTSVVCINKICTSKMIIKKKNNSRPIVTRCMNIMEFCVFLSFMRKLIWILFFFTRRSIELR